MLESIRGSASLVTAGLRLAAIVSLLLLSGCGGGSGSGSEPADEVVDQCPVDDTKIEEGLCGCGIPDTDSDNDGTPDCQDACPEDPGTIPDKSGFCGDTGDFATVVEGEALTLAVNGAVLTIPADALAPGTAVTLTEIDPASLDEQPNGPSENRVTPIYALEFSEAQLAGENLIFALDVPAAIGSSTYTGIQTTGGLSTDDYSDIEWLLHFGDFDATQSLLIIELGATATRFLVAGLTRTPADAAAIATDEAPQMPALMKARALTIPAITAAAATGTSAWAEHGFIVACMPSKFLKRDDERCDPLSPGFVPMMSELGRALYESAQQLTSMGFSNGRLTRVHSLPVVDIPKLVYDPDGLSDATAASTGDALSYWLAWADPKVGNTVGYYDPSIGDGDLYMDVDRPVDRTSRTAIHELMHSVQREEIRGNWAETWIIEGLAASVEPNAPSYSGPTGPEFRKYGNEYWRDWKIVLTSDEGVNEYEAHEFWLSLTGDMGMIPLFYGELEFIIGKDAAANSLQRVDEALIGTGLPSLPDAYTDLILTRDGQADYPHCKEKVFSCSGSCSEAITDFSAMSAQCIDFNVAIEDTCEGVPAEISVTLELASPNPDIKLMVDGVIHEADIPVPFSDEGRIWAINTSFDTSSSPAANLVFKNEASCNIKLLQQRLQLVSASNLSISGEWQLDRIQQVYYSFEDLTQPSYISTQEGPGSVWIDVPAEPLAFLPWSESFSSAVQWDQGDNDYNSSGSASIHSQTTKVSTGLMTTGQVETLGFASHTAISNLGTMYTRSGASGLYIFKTKDVAAELNLTWGCDLSSVKVYYLHPTTFKTGELILSHSNSFSGANNWECSPTQLIIPPNTTFRVSFVSRYEVTIGSIGTDPNRNEGGSFEIDIRPIEASD